MIPVQREIVLQVFGGPYDGGFITVPPVPKHVLDVICFIDFMGHRYKISQLDRTTMRGKALYKYE
jgi:hypothetical protein